MNYIAMPRGRGNAFSDLQKTVAQLDEKCLQIVTLIKEAFQRGSMLGAGACQIESGFSENIVAVFESPLGSGRIVRTWSQGDQYLQAELEVQRKCRDEYDRHRWEAVWGLTVPLYDSCYSGKSAEALEFDLDGFEGDNQNAAFRIALSILYGLVNGPSSLVVS
jgi:hypothetical protein